MAPTAQFVADFTDFIRGVNDGMAEVVKLENEGKEFGSAWDSALKDADFERLMNQPLKEGVSIAKDFAEALGPIGKTGILVATGITAVSSALAALAFDTAETAANLGDLADMTGMTVPGLSHLSDAADVAGTDIDKLSNVIYSMQKRMAQHPDDFEQGLERLGLTMKEFMALDADKQLLAIADGLKAQTDPLERVRAGNELLGTQYRTMGATLLDLADAQQLVKDRQPFTAEDAAAAESFQMQWNALKLELKGVGEEIGRAVIPAFTELIKIAREGTGTMKGFWDATKTELSAWGVVWEAAIYGKVTDTAPAVDDLEKKMAALHKTTMTTGQLAVPTLADALAHSREMAKLNAESLAENNKAMAEETRLAEAAAAANARMVAEQDKLNELHVKRELELNQQLQAELAKTTAARTKLTNDAILRELDATVQLNAAQGLNAQGVMQTTETAYTRYAEKMEQITALKIEGISTEKQEALALSQLQMELLKEAQAQDAANLATAKVPQVAGPAIASLQQMGLASQQAAQYFEQLKGTIDNAVYAANAMAASSQKLGGQLAESNITQVGKNLYNKKTGEYVGELEAKYGAGGFLGYGVRGAVGEQAVTNVNIYGSVLGSSADLARAVGGALTDTYRSGGNRLPV